MLSSHPPPPPSPPLQDTALTPLATFPPVATSATIMTSAKKLDFSTHIELNGVANENEYIIVEKNICLQWLSSIARCKCGE